MKLAFVKHEDIAQNIKSFWFRPLAPVTFIAGQYTQLHLPHKDADERGQKRWFTISSAPGEELLSITTKIDPVKPSSFKRELLNLKTGFVLTADDPLGDFVLPKDQTTPLIFIAGGIGITPYHSIVQWLQMQREKRHIHLIYGVNNPKELAYIPLFKETIDVTVLVSSPSPDWTGQTGRISANLILQQYSKANSSLIFIAGPEPMVEVLNKDLINSGINQANLVTDYFPGYPTL